MCSLFQWYSVIPKDLRFVFYLTYNLIPHLREESMLTKWSEYLWHHELCFTPWTWKNREWENISNGHENRAITKTFGFKRLPSAISCRERKHWSCSKRRWCKKKSTQAPPQFPDGLGNINRAAGGEGEEAPPAVPPHASHLLPKQGAFSQSFNNIWRLSTFHGTSVLSQSAQLTQTAQ